jgi:hypothetical protein
MLKEASIIIIAICCCFLFIPLTWMIYSAVHSPIGAIISIAPLLVVLGFAVYDAKKLYDNKEHRLAKNFILSLILSIIISFIIIGAIWRYTIPPIVA